MSKLMILSAYTNTRVLNFVFCDVYSNTTHSNIDEGSRKKIQRKVEGIYDLVIVTIVEALQIGDV